MGEWERLLVRSERGGFVRASCVSHDDGMMTPRNECTYVYSTYIEPPSPPLALLYLGTIVSVGSYYVLVQSAVLYSAAFSA